MAAKGHPDFKSVEPHVPDTNSLSNWFHETLRDKVRYAFSKHCPPWEMCEWKRSEFNDFTVEVDKIDRFYLIQVDSDFESDEYENYFRMDYNGRSLYVMLKFTRPLWMLPGQIYLTFNGEVFLKAIITTLFTNNEIYNLMVEDGLAMDEPSHLDSVYTVQNFSWFYRMQVGSTEFPTLKFWCHMTVYENREQLQHYAEFLPYHVAKGVDQFINIRRTGEHYSKCMEEEEDYDDGSYVSHN